MHMKYEWVDEYCVAEKGIQKDFKMEWDAVKYLISEKMFVMQG